MVRAKIEKKERKTLCGLPLVTIRAKIAKDTFLVGLCLE